MNIRFMCLSSGSSGNCFFLGTEKYGILIDAGISVRSIRNTLRSIGMDLKNIHAVFVTHDHADHIKAVGNIAAKSNIPIYATRIVHEGIRKSYCVTKKLTPDNIKYVEKEQPLQLEDFTIEPFEVPHDGSDNVGYCIEIDGKVFSFLTDLGEITPTAERYIEKANYLILEANYDMHMLMTGRYSDGLKERVNGSHGHLCNDATAAFLATHYSPKLKYIWLCHLSADNNRPDLAYKTVKQKMEEANIKVGETVQLSALQRGKPSPLYQFE